MKKIYTIRDKKLGTYFPPNYANHETELTRALSEIVQTKPEHQFAKYSTDFELYEIGTFNESTGKIIPFDAEKFVLTLSELSNQPEVKQ